MRWIIAAIMRAICGATPEEELPANVDEIKTLTVHQANALLAAPKHRAWLLLNGLTQLTPEVAAALARHKGSHLSLNGLTTLSPGAAEALAKHAGRNLSLDGLATLEPGVAKALAKYEGRLWLGGLTSIPREAAAARLCASPKVRVPGECRMLRSDEVEIGQQSVESPAAAAHAGLTAFQRVCEKYSEAIAEFVDEAINTATDRYHASTTSTELPNDTRQISALTVEQARGLVAAHEGESLVLNGLRWLTPEVAEALATHWGRLCLSGLTKLTPKAAIALAGHEGPSLFLDGLTTLPPKAAYALASHEGFVSLRRLERVTDGAANALRRNPDNQLSWALWRRHEEEKEPNVDKFFPLVGVPKDTCEITTLTGEQAKALALKHKGRLYLDGLTAITPEVARMLAKYTNRNGLSLSGLKSLTQEDARVLAEYRGDLFLDGLTTLTPTVARALAMHRGYLYLDGVATLCLDVAKRLAMHDGSLSLCGLTSLTPEIARVLAKHKGDVWIYQTRQSLPRG